MKLFTSFVTPNRIQECCDKNILPIIILRNIRNSSVLANFSDTPIHFKELAPSNNLYRLMRDKKIDFEEYSNEYKKELSAPTLLFSSLEKLKFMMELCNVDSAVFLAYGSDDKISHRSILRDFIYESGLLGDIKIEEL